jgi:hypothetical protein
MNKGDCFFQNQIPWGGGEDIFEAFATGIADVNGPERRVEVNFVAGLRGLPVAGVSAGSRCDGYWVADEYNPIKLKIPRPLA